MNVKELFENEELMNNIVEDLEDFPEDTEITYEVWALGYTKDDDCTDDEVLVGEFTDPDTAVAYAEKVNLELIKELGYGEADPATAYFSIEVETVVDDEDNDCTMNIGSVYQRDLWLDGEYGDEESAGLGDYSNVVCVTEKDFELLEDGTLKVSCKLLRDFNKNDNIFFEFSDEPDITVLPYKITSKVEYKDGDYYHCELTI